MVTRSISLAQNHEHLDNKTFGKKIHQLVQHILCEHFVL